MIPHSRDRAARDAHAHSYAILRAFGASWRGTLGWAVLPVFALGFVSGVINHGAPSPSMIASAMIASGIDGG